MNRLDIHDLYLAAHDFGGPVPLSLLRLHPQFKIHRLMISSTNLFTDTPIPFPLRSAGIPILGDMVYKAMAGSPFGFRMMYQFAAVNKKAACWEDFSRHITPHGMSSTARIFQHSIADLRGNYRSIEEFASQIEIPTLIVWGDRDPIFPVAVAKRSGATIPNAALKIYKQTGHFKTIKNLSASNPIVATKEKGTFSEEKAKVRAIDIAIAELGRSLSTELDGLDWFCRIAKVEGEEVYINAGRLTGLKVGDVMDVFRPIGSGDKREVKGKIKISAFFGIDASMGLLMQGKNPDVNDILKLAKSEGT